jgi:cytochrome bd-type quinol oxidase subunit 2
MWMLKFILIAVLLFVFFQDSKERKVYWFFYPIVGVLVFVMQIIKISIYPALINSGFNLSLVFLIIMSCFVYVKLKLHQPLTEVLGLGDILFFIAIAFSFSIVSFLFLFVFALLFSLLLHLVLQQRQTDKTVPLAGNMALFFGVVYGVSFLCECNFLYAY